LNELHYPSSAATRRTATLLRCGVAAGPLYIAIGLAQVLVRDGFDVRRHALSLLSNGDYGWVQTGNFLLSGILVIIGAVGLRRLLYPGRGGTWGPILLAVYGLGLIGAGLFAADPAPDFPPGAHSGATEMSRTGLLHFVFGGIGFYALIAACLVFAWRFASLRQTAWAAYSAFTGVAFLMAFALIASGTISTAAMLAFYAAVAWIWIWHAALTFTHLHALRTVRSRQTEVTC
jgi:hypothetical protein